MSANYAWSANLGHDVWVLWQFEFLRTALWAGLVVALLCGAVGWLVVLRGETYAAHTLSAAAFPGAAGAALVGLSPLFGYVGFAVAAAVLLGVLGGGAAERATGSTAVIGAVQALMLGLGYWFLTLAHGPLQSLTSFLFGTFLGITTGDLVVLVVVAAVALAALAALGRPLLLAAVDPVMAEARGLRVRLLSMGFLVLLALAVAQAAQFTGVLLVFALLVTPAATAQRLVQRPSVGIALSMLLAVLTVWIGLATAFFTNLPVGYWVTVVGFAGYALVRVVQSGRAVVRRRTARRAVPIPGVTR